MNTRFIHIEKIQLKNPGILFLILLFCNGAAYTQTKTVNQQIKDTIPSIADTVMKKAVSLPKTIGSDIKKQKDQFGSLFKNIHQKPADSIPANKKNAFNPVKVVTKQFIPDSIKSKTDSSLKHLMKSERNAYTGKINAAKEKLLGMFRSPKKKRSDSLILDKKFTEPEHLLSKPLVGFGGGYINYNYNYRSATDTPFAEQNIGQHNITGSVNTVIARALPFNINFWVRRSNSILYRDITDIQVSFDAAGFRNQLVNNLQRRLLAFTASIKDSLLEKLAGLRSMELVNTDNWLKSPFNIQRIHEYKELIQIDAAHPENRPADSAARQQFDLQIKAATAFVQGYDSARLQYDHLSHLTDSLKNQLALQRRNLAQYRQVLNGKFSGWSSYNDWRGNLNKHDPGGLEVPDKYKWLMGIRNFSLGKTPVNYSELTAKNMSLTGINFEYNSWYYLAVAAGVIDYRFRDFVVTKDKRSPQYLYMLRAGIGRIERNYFIVSFFKGQKQLYSVPVNSQQSNAINITGITAETKWQVNNHSYVIAEVGESVSPDYRSTPPVQNGKFSLNGNTNKALSVKFYTSFPQLGGRAEGMYKYTGANYQSFSSFQTNAAVKSWWLKWEQNFFKRKLRITGALRSNEFTNPYIVQNYKSNTIFKSINAVFRMRKWPIISVGYIPMSQLSVVGQQVMENRFQTLTASINHFYKIGNRQAFTMFVYNKFYNTNTDSGFIYFNASNFYLSQNIVFRFFTAGLGIADSKSNQYHLTAAEINLRIPLFQKTVLGMGMKINNLNKQETKTGWRFNIEMGITRKDRISLNYEKSYLPGTGKQLLNSDMGNIQYSRYF